MVKLGSGLEGSVIELDKSFLRFIIAFLHELNVYIAMLRRVHAR